MPPLIRQTLLGRVRLVRCGVIAARVIGAAVEFAVFALTERQSSSASGADAVGDCDVAFEFVVADINDVLFLGGFVFYIVGLEEIGYVPYLTLSEDSVLKLVDYSRNLVPVDDGRMGVNTEAGLPGKCDYRDVRYVSIFLQKESQCPDMALILLDGVAKPVLVTIDVLRPIFAVFASVNPALIELGLDDEDAINGSDNVVNLGAVAVAGEKQVVDVVSLGVL